MALGEVGVWLPWWCHSLALLPPGYWRLFLNLKPLAHNGKITNFRGILGQSWNSEFHKVKMLKFQNFNFDLKFLWNWSFFHYKPKVLDLKKVSSNLEPEGQGRGIIMGVTCLLLLGPFYTIQTKTDQTFWRGVYDRRPVKHKCPFKANRWLGAENFDRRR